MTLQAPRLLQCHYLSLITSNRARWGQLGAYEDTLDTIMSSTPIDGAILAVSLQGESTFVAAAHLMRRQIPFIFLVGHITPDIPDQFDEIERVEEPVQPGALLHSMNLLIQD